MPKIKLTKGALKKERDSLRQYNRFLPTLQLKKQQLQAEILKQSAALAEKEISERAMTADIAAWAGLLTDDSTDIRPYLKCESVNISSRNIAGTDVPVFVSATYAAAEYDLFTAPLWLDSAIEHLRALASLREEVRILKEGVKVLKQELRITTQRVNLFEKVKIPQAEEAIRRIKIFIGDQMANAVGRSKIAKRKINMALLVEPAS